MADVRMSTAGVDILNDGTAPVFEIRDHNGLIGRLTVSRGGVRWLPTGFQEPPHMVNWADFDGIMRQHPRQG